MSIDYFTKGQLIEFAGTIAEDVSAEVNSYYKISDLCVKFQNDTQTIVISLLGEKGKFTVEHDIDMQNIEDISNLFIAYLNVYINDFVNAINAK